MSLTRAPKMLEDDLSSAERKRQIATGQQPALHTVDRRRKGICTLRARETVQKLRKFSAAVANCSRDRTATEQTADRLVKKCHSRRRQAGELDRFYGAPSAHLARARVPIGPSAARVKKPLSWWCVKRWEAAQGHYEYAVDQYLPSVEGGHVLTWSLADACDGVAVLQAWRRQRRRSVRIFAIISLLSSSSVTLQHACSSPLSQAVHQGWAPQHLCQGQPAD